MTGVTGALGVGGVRRSATWGPGAGASVVLGTLGAVDSVDVFGNVLGSNALGNIDVRTVLNESLGRFGHSKNPTLCNALFKIIAVKAELMQMKAAKHFTPFMAGIECARTTLQTETMGSWKLFVERL